MKGLSDLDLVNNIVGNAKVVAPGSKNYNYIIDIFF